jgi:hypothetical protein
MILIFSGNSAEAHDVARALHLKSGQWAYLSNINKLRRLRSGLGDAPRVFYYGHYAKRQDYEEIEGALFHLGATREVISERTISVLGERK